MLLFLNLFNVKLSMRILTRFLKEETATSAVEYAVILALIVAVCVVAITELGNASYDALWDVVEALEDEE